MQSNAGVFLPQQPAQMRRDPGDPLLQIPVRGQCRAYSQKHVHSFPLVPQTAVNQGILQSLCQQRSKLFQQGKVVRWERIISVASQQQHADLSPSRTQWDHTSGTDAPGQKPFRIWKLTKLHVAETLEI